MFSSWFSVWTTASRFMRSSGSNNRSTRPSPALKTRPKRPRTFPWSSAGTRATARFTVKFSARRSSSWSPATSSARTSRSPPRGTLTWTRCSRDSLPSPNYPTRWALTSIARCPCSTATFCTRSPSETRRSRTATRTASLRLLRAVQACTVTWCTSKRRR